MEKEIKYYLLSGEASGDLHAANLVKALRRQVPLAKFRSWGGGAEMESISVPLAKHYRELAFMGFVEVVKNLGTILKNFSACKADILAFQPDVLILVDYPGFNLRMAKWAKAQDFPVIYYIAPQLWAWNKGRIKIFKRYVNHLLVILPFEKAFFEKEGYQQVTYVGHPLLDHTRRFQVPQDFRQKHQLDQRPIIALLPGSRKQEIRTILPIFLRIKQHFSAYQFVIAGAPGQDSSFYDDLLEKESAKVRVLFDQTYALLHQAEAALVTSGTATLETALFHTPQVVCYKGNSISYQIAKRLIQVPYISLVNLIANREVVRELIQYDFTEDKVVAALRQLLAKKTKDDMLAAYQTIQQQLGNGNASEAAAQKIIELTPG